MQIKQITILYILLSILCLILVFSFTGKANAEEIIIDNFDSYTNGTDLAGQGLWDNAINNRVEISNAISHSPSNSIRANGVTFPALAGTSITSISAGDEITIYFYPVNEGSAGNQGYIGWDTSGVFSQINTNIIQICGNGSGQTTIRGTGTTCSSGNILYSGLAQDTWHKLNITFTGTNENYTVSLNDSAPSAEETLNITPLFLVLSMPSGTRNLYFDTVGGIQNLNTNTRINWLTPPPDTASTTFDVEFEYYINSNDEDADIWENILLQTCALSYFNDECEIHATSFTILYDQLVQETIEITTTRQGFHLGIISFWNNVEENTECPWWNFLCSDESIITGLSDSSRFNVETTEIAPNVPGYILDLDFDGSGLCDVTIVSGICNALMFLFIPSENSIQNFLSLQGDLAEKIPFGFVFSITEKMQNILETGGSEGSDVVVNLGEDSIGNITIFSWTDAKDTLEDLGIYNTGIVNILSYIMWILMAVYVFTRLTKNKDL